MPEFFRHEGLQDAEAANPGQHIMLVCAGFGFLTGFLALMVAAHPKETAAGCAVGLITAALFGLAAMQANVYFGIA